MIAAGNAALQTTTQSASDTMDVSTALILPTMLNALLQVATMHKTETLQNRAHEGYGFFVCEGVKVVALLCAC